MALTLYFVSMFNKFKNYNFFKSIPKIYKRPNKMFNIIISKLSNTKL